MNAAHHDDRGWTLYQADYRDTLAAVAEAGGDLGARVEDGVPWVTVAHTIINDSKRQQGLFG